MKPNTQWAERLTPASGSPLPTDPAIQPGPIQERRPLYRRIGGTIVVIVALIAKFAAKLKLLLLLLPKAKVLTTSVSALVSIGAYSIVFGWQFAVGFVVLLFVHEMGHVIQLRREGIPASAPMFIPFLGAVVSAKSLGDNALAEARVGLAGPILGSLGAAAVALAAVATHSSLLYALAYTAFFLNLFNLIPVTPLDGGRAMAAMAPWMWIVGLAVLASLIVVLPSHNPLLLLFLLIGGLDVFRRLRARRDGGAEQAAYYRVAPRARLAVGAVYIGLIVLLVVGMYETYVARTL